MQFRITSSSYATRAIHFSAFHGNNILKFQKQLSSGVQFERPSEQPIGFQQVTTLRSRFAELQADRTSINRATAILNTSVINIQEFSDLVTRAKTLTQQGIQAFDGDERNALALEVEGLLERLKSVSQASFDGRFLYGGTASNQPPFEFSESGAGLEISYLGTAQRSRASVGDSIAIDTYYNGLEIFGGSTREPTVIVGNTGAQPGPGTDTLTSRAELLVTHTLTTYAGASGILAGTDSVGGDTIIGQTGTHRVTIVDTAGDGSAGTISLNNASPVAFTNADTNLRVEGLDGQVIYVDTTAIAAGFNGTVDITATGSMSVDGGATSIAIDHTSNQIVEDSVSGNAVTIDSTQLQLAGTDFLEFPGTSNAFQVLDTLITDLRNDRNLIDSQRSEALTRRLGELEGIASNVFEILAEQSTSLSTLDGLGYRVEELMNSVEISISEVQSTDVAEATLRFANSQSLLEYTYAATAQISSLSLLNFLR